MNRRWKILGIGLFLILTVLATTACSGTQSGSPQQVQAVKGDIALKVSGSGKVGVDKDANPSFGSGGKITELNVKEGDKVTKGQVLARLETDTLELALSQAQVAQSQAEVASTQAQIALTQAQTSLAAAQFNLDKTQAVSAIKDQITTLQNKITAAQVNLDQARASGDIDGANIMLAYIASTQFELLSLQSKLQTLLTQPEYSDSAGYYLTISGQTYDRLTLQDVHLKELAVESAQLSVTQAGQNIELTKRSVDQAGKAVAVAQNQLNNATITSPIDGVAVTVNVKEGDMVSPTSFVANVPIYIIDPGTMQVTAQIDEVDIANVKLGQKVDITLDSAPNIIYAGKVNSIALAPLSNPQNSGVVVYEVKIGFVNPPPPEVKVGMSATADIISIEKTGAILVPSRAIKTDQQGNPQVDIIVNSKVESRKVQVGISDGINTEITSGLNGGETVVIIPASQSSGLFGQ
jgi:HlyD family secretion protein